jgi:stage II sporulation protein D
VNRVGAISFATVALVSGLAAHADDRVRVRIEAGARSVPVSGEALRVEGERVPDGRVVVEPTGGGGIRAGSVTRSGSIRLISTGPIRVRDRALPGTVTVRSAGENGLDVINEVALEPYVERAVAGEVYADWPMEALKAQAVLGRTYALYERQRHRGADFDLEGSVLSQKYAAGPVPVRVQEAVGSTRGEFLSFGGEPILAAFHSAAGGQTATAEEVWGESLPYLRAVDSPDQECPEYFWSYEIERDDLMHVLKEAGFVPVRGEEIRVVERTASGRVAALQVAGVEFSGRSLREVLGGRAIRSTLFDVRVQDGLVRFLGSGAGHGVGLSQWGAHQMAREGRSYREILAHYFPGTRLRQQVASAARLDELSR